MMADADFYCCICKGDESMGLWYTGEDGYIDPTGRAVEQTANSNGEKADRWMERPVRSFT